MSAASMIARISESSACKRCAFCCRKEAALDFIQDFSVSSFQTMPCWMHVSDRNKGFCQTSDTVEINSVSVSQLELSLNGYVNL
jgi:hypothetical protein